ncbi:MAG: HAD hydrolase-like protein [Acidimicrobiales bacterium]
MSARRRMALFDFDGTLVDSDAALLAPYTALGIEAQAVPPLGLPLSVACDQAGVTVADYLELYDASAAMPFPGIDHLIHRLPGWGLCSNKLRDSGERELARLGWHPTVARFSDDFGGRPKALDPVLLALELAPGDALFVGDTDHDRACAELAGVDFALAGWNPRALQGARPGELVLDQPDDVLALLD